ncbi:ABC transporter G family member 27 isoform X1 [Lingula anatina]|uniref:ABC transporter G family member 27 isoform X1 n=2 Tax=Lingula anatina TaxID=7574 RepID=A0A1S3JSX8_LINAN|nr:ABC transporter G family member 27 isoform X1 [Lingula anatina]|eukprot:XP_013413427.1 ABC transporter G family member 27 isoform X1 [Lingula anatina]
MYTSAVEHKERQKTGTSHKYQTSSREMELLFHNINVTINKKHILHDISGMAKPGKLLAVMGPSGSGKTTLLSAIAGRVPRDKGDVLLDGQSLSKPLKRKICYVLQSDIFFANLTLKETLVYTALLRLPDSMPHKEKMARVDEIVNSLDIKKCLNTLIGSISQRGLSGGEKKRANIACELLTNPKIMLLDEPTSGLDSCTAFSLMKNMKDYSAVHNKTVVTTIHQPSSQIFHMFDSLLLLCEGHMAYFGDAGKMVDFFSSMGLHCTPLYNPADFMMEKMKDSDEVQNLIINSASALRQSDQWPNKLKALDLKILANNKGLTNRNDKGDIDETEDARPCNFGFGMNSEDKEKGPYPLVHQASEISICISKEMASKYLQQKYDDRWPTSWWTQYHVLTRRNFTQSKAKIWSKINLIHSVVIAIIAGLLWFQLPRTEETIADRKAVIFFIYVYWSFIPLSYSVSSFPEERTVIDKERSSGAYRLSAYYLAKMTSELPLTLLLPSGFVLIVFWMAGLNGFWAYIGFWATVMLTSLFAQAAGFVIGVAVMDVKLCISVSKIFILTSMLAGGFLTTNTPFWLDWIKYLSFIYYSYHIGVILEFTEAPPFR